jgi:hypothetical protein
MKTSLVKRIQSSTSLTVDRDRHSRLIVDFAKTAQRLPAKAQKAATESPPHKDCHES